MKKITRIISLVVIMTITMSMSMCMSAYAGSDIVTVKIEKGDTVYCLCQELGLSYNSCKETIMNLNGFSSESELAKVKVGETISFPAKNVNKTSNIPEGDRIAYYLMPFLIKEGDYLYGIYNLWGLDYDDYSEDILYMNYIPNPDKLPIGQLLWLPTNAENLMGNDYTTVAAHTMKKGETAYDVCQSYDMDYYEVEERLVRFNCGQDMTKLQAGQELKIPLS